MDKLVSILCPPEGEEKYLEFARTDDGGLELYVEDGWINEIEKT
jgi:hypothetical protein